MLEEALREMEVGSGLGVPKIKVVEHVALAVTCGTGRQYCEYSSTGTFQLLPPVHILHCLCKIRKVAQLSAKVLRDHLYAGF